MSDTEKRVALTITYGDQKREITFDELTLSNNFALEAIVKLLVDKKVIELKELQETMEIIRKERYIDTTPKESN
jgi:hypothetical protein